MPQTAPDCSGMLRACSGAAEVRPGCILWNAVAPNLRRTCSGRNAQLQAETGHGDQEARQGEGLHHGQELRQPARIPARGVRRAEVGTLTLALRVAICDAARRAPQARARVARELRAGKFMRILSLAPEVL